MSETKEQQLFFMRLAIQIAEKGRLTAPPNPWVGCLIVANGEKVGEGYHIAPGHPHAEVVALEQAGPLAYGATAYISLEPCAHTGRTPPCAEALIKAGISHVVIPILDPDPNVSGQGVKTLESAGIQVTLGIAAEEAKRSLTPYLHHRETGTPYVILKSAMSIDGRTAAADGTSKWITSEEARNDVQRLRAESQAILVGSQTALKDQPKLTARYPSAKQPLRVLIDSKGIVPKTGPLFDETLGPTLVFDKKISLSEILAELGKRGIMQLLVEGGAHLHSAFFTQNLAHKLVLYIGDCLLGPNGLPLLPVLNVQTIKEAPRLTLEGVHRFGDAARLEYAMSNR